MAEPRALIEIYQPLIVGLGAVALGFMANGLLEWWRSWIAERKERRTLRLALIFELEEIARLFDRLSKDDFIQNGDQIRVGIPSGFHLMNMVPSEIGKLSLEEVEALGELIASWNCLDAVRDSTKTETSRRFNWIDLPSSQTDSARQVFRQCAAEARAACKAIRSRRLK